MLKEFFIEPFTDNTFLGYVVGILVWILTLALLAGVILLSIYLIDSVGRPMQKKDGIVIDKYIVPAHRTTSFIMSGKVMVPITTYHSTAYKLKIKIDDLTDDVSFSKSFYDGAKIGQTIH